MPGQSHNAGMKTWITLSLAFLSTAGATPTPASKAPPGTTPADVVVVNRCTDAKGRVTLQDEPCPKGSQGQAREMTRPKDPPKSARVPSRAMPMDVLPDEPAPPLRRELIPPPPMYRCTSYDGIERFSESYDPNPRCEPLVLYYPYPNNLTPAQALSCRWVEDSCVRLSDSSACARWKEMRKDAVSAVTRSFSDTAAYRKSELERLNQITDESCP